MKGKCLDETMQSIMDLHIATNLEDLKRIAYPDKLGRNPKALEKVIKNLYQEIFHEVSDQEKCYIHCFRYLLVIETLCKITDGKFIRLFYDRDIARVKNKIDELRPVLEQRYNLERKRQRKEEKSITPTAVATPELTINKQLFPDELITVKQLFEAIQDKANILIVDIRPVNEYAESKIKFENIINVPEDLIAAGSSASVLGNKLTGDTQKIWDKRDTFDALVFLDWSSDADNITCTKLNYLKDAVVEWDIRRKYKQHPVILNGGFKDFLDSYPGSVTNVHVNFIRNNEDIDELLELDSIYYPEPDQNVSIMPLKQFTIEELEDSVTIEETSEETMDVDEPIVDKGQDNDGEMSLEGGGAVIEKTPIPPATLIDEVPEKEIKHKIEEQRLLLLKDARNKKIKGGSIKDKNVEFIEDQVGDKVEKSMKIVPPPIRRETKPKKIDIPWGGWCGLVNIKNTCYMNSIMQCLKCVPVIRNIAHSNYEEKYVTRRPPRIIKEFAALIRTLSAGTETDKKVHRPSSFYDVVCRLDPLYKKGNHEDCMEFFLFLFNHLHDDCSYDIRKKSTTMIEREKAWYGQLLGRTSFWVDLFYHQFKSVKICRTCRATADTYETDNTLMLSVPYRPGLRTVYLRDLIGEYLEDNQILDYKCSKCQNFGVINRKEIVVAPEILVLVLKRYYQDEYQETRKNNVCVDFDFEFEFGNFRYKLFSVAEHRGTMDHGHYFAHGRLNETTWVEFNDEKTTRYSGDWETVKGAACAFFYCKSKAIV